MTNRQVLAFANGLQGVDAPDMEGDFNYAISANKAEAKRIAVSINAAIKPNEAMEKYEQERRDLIIKHCDKDERGEPISRVVTAGDQTFIKYNVPDIDDPKSDYNRELGVIKENYKGDIEAHEKKLKFLDKDNSEFKPIMIPRKDIPKGLSREAMDLILPLVKKDA